MELKLDIGWQQLLRLIEQLPKAKRQELKTILAQKEKTKQGTQDLRNLLLNGPTFTDEQLQRMADARASIEKWRKK